MPCTTDYPDEPTHLYGVTLGEFDELLCHATTSLRKNPSLEEHFFSSLSAEQKFVIQRWGREHREADKRREEILAKDLEEERLRREALAKLSLAERKILGI